MCTYIKLQRQLKEEQSRTNKGLGDFYPQYDPSYEEKKKPKCKGNCPLENPKRKFRKKEFSKRPRDKPKRKINKNFTCYTCRKKGHTAKYCRINKRLNELQIDEDTIYQLNNIFIATDYDTSS